MRAVIGPLLASGQRRRDRKVEKFIIGRGDLTDRTEIGVEPAVQAEGGNAPGRFRRDVTDRARLGEEAPQLNVGPSTLGMDIGWRRLRLDRTLRIVAMTLRPDLELGAKVGVIVAMVRSVPAQRADRKIKRIGRQIA